MFLYLSNCRLEKIKSNGYKIQYFIKCNYEIFMKSNYLNVYFEWLYCNFIVYNLVAQMNEKIVFFNFKIYCENIRTNYNNSLFQYRDRKWNIFNPVSGNKIITKGDKAMHTHFLILEEEV